MLNLTRKVLQADKEGNFTNLAKATIVIEDIVKIYVVKIKGKEVILGIDAPTAVDIRRGEIWEEASGKKLSVTLRG